jgi:type IV secretion system protein VirB9
MRTRILFLATLVAASVFATDPAPEVQAAKSRRARPTAAKTRRALVQDETSVEPSTGRVVTYGARDVIAVKAKIRYTTMIVLPKNERILDFTCGDKDFWIVNGNQNFAYVKPAQVASHTNLNLVTASGNVYSFVLSEVSEVPGAVPDLKVFVVLRDEAMLNAERAKPKYVPAPELDACKDQLQKANQEVRRIKDEEQAAITKAISKYAANLRFTYRFTPNKRPFFVRAIYHDDRFTYIEARPEETPTLYELRDGSPNLVGFEYHDGVFIVYKVLDEGYLAIGRQKLGFKREE